MLDVPKTLICYYLLTNMNDGWGPIRPAGPALRDLPVPLKGVYRNGPFHKRISVAGDPLALEKTLQGVQAGLSLRLRHWADCPPVCVYQPAAG